MYVFVSSGVAIASNTFAYSQPGFVHTLLVIALGNGLAFTCLVFAFYHLSGGHLNPATTWGAIITRRIGIMRGIAYIVAQVVGAILGALLISAATPSEFHHRIGAQFWEESLSTFSGFLLEATLTFFLVLVVFATHFDPAGMGSLAPLPIGLTVTFGYLIGWVFVGPPMNPARALGTAIVYGTYDHMWVYWAGPFAGASVASLLYTLLFLSRPITSADVKPAVAVTEATRLLNPSGTATV
jgi:MIP family channel proteins